jgi:SAM-dependent methyltransferase
LQRNTSVRLRAKDGSAGSGTRQILTQRVTQIHDVLSDHALLPLGERRILDVGCGTGRLIGTLLELGARPDRLVGIDLVADHIEIARRSYPDVSLICGDAEDLEVPPGSFDVVVASTVFTSILDDATALNLAGAMRRALKPGGSVLWYDFRYANPGNPNTRAMPKRRIRRLFPDFGLDLRSTTLLPPLARRLGRLAPLLYGPLAAVTPLRTHYVGLLVSPNDLGSASP